MKFTDTYLECQYCGKKTFDEVDRYCFFCGKGFTNQTFKKKEGEWIASWTEIHRPSGIKLHLEVNMGAPEKVFVNLYAQLGTTHITEAGFDRELYPTGRIPLENFWQSCEERYKGKIPVSRDDLAKMLGVSRARVDA